MQATLDWCNERRVEKGMEPLDKLPKGKRGQPKSCPCGAATGLNVGSSFWFDPTTTKPSPRIPLPTEVTEFVIAFDSGMLPQYDVYGY